MIKKVFLINKITQIYATPKLQVLIMENIAYQKNPEIGRGSIYTLAQQEIQ
jgi:hypothetical protein